MVAHTMHCMQESPANALATNKDATQIVIAGRSVFKVYSIEDDEFAEKLNLRVGKNLNLNFSCADVVWNTMDDQVLATAATNGAVVTWNLNKSSRSKQDIVFQDHKRTVNKVCFHEKEPNILISGSQDGTMKIFDLRKKEATSTFYSMSESVRDVQFSPSQYFQFAAVQENGNVQLWDWRRTDRCERQFTAHNGPVFALDWHPEEKKWLATAGRDKTIKVWDVGNKPFPDHVIQTIASVSRIKWRPSRKFHLASSSLVVDFSVNVWDVRRTYIPYASFTEHKDVTTGILWRKDPKILLSVSKDCSLYQHVFQDAFRPADHVNPIAMDLNSFGDIALAASDRIISENLASSQNYKSNNYSSTRLPFMFRRGQSKGDQFQISSSTFHVFKNNNEEHTSSESFIKFAKEFQLMGRSKSDLCDNNASVCTEMKCLQKATTWSVLKILFGKNTSNLSSDSAYRLDGDISSTHIDSIDDSRSQHLSGGNQGLRSANPRSRHHSGGGDRIPNVLDIQRSIRGDTSGFSDEGSDSSDFEPERITSLNSACIQNPSDYFFCDADTNMNMLGYDYSQVVDQTLDHSSDWMLPNEPFAPRHPIEDQCAPPELGNGVCTLDKSCDEDDNHVIRGSNKVKKLSTEEDHSNLLLEITLPSLSDWDFVHIVVDMLNHYAKQGDVQMCVSVLIIFSDELKEKIDETIQEQWFHSYIDLLQRFQLWTVSNSVIKLSGLPNVNSYNQQSTTVHTLCNNCGRNMNRVGWWCERCKKSTNSCSVCHQQVRGLYVWCQGCSHGGHLEHMREWMQKYSLCPAGCGHKCNIH